MYTCHEFPPCLEWSRFSASWLGTMHYLYKYDSLYIKVICPAFHTLLSIQFYTKSSHFRKQIFSNIPSKLTMKRKKYGLEAVPIFGPL